MGPLNVNTRPWNVIMGTRYVIMGPWNVNRRPGMRLWESVM